MKSLAKRIIAASALLCVAFTTLGGCGGKKEESSENVTQFPFDWGSASDNALEDPNDPLAAEDPTAPADSITADKPSDVEETTEIQAVTDAEGQPVTEIQQVTDAEGQPVTDAQGQPVTEAVPVTTVVKVTTPASGTSTQTGYTAKKDGRYVMWLDISKDENFYFEKDFVEVTFKVKKDIPDGDYSFDISPDLSDIAGVAVKPSNVINGTIRVNNGSIEPVDVSGETGSLVFYGDNVACKQGDEIKMHINLKNNSGLAAFCIWFYFDSNAFECVDVIPCGEYEEIARNVDTGGSGVVKD